MRLNEFLKDPFAILLLAVFVVNVVVYVILQDNEDLTNVVSLTYCLVPALSSAVIFTVYSFYGKQSVEGKIWLYIFLGMLLWTIGEIMWVYYDLSGQDPFPSLADVIFIAAYIPIIYGVVSKARYTKVRKNKRNDSIILLILASIIIPTIVYVGYPIITDNYYDLTSKVVSLLYPLLDVLLLAYALFIALYWGPTVSRGWYILAAAMIFMTAADIGYAALEWREIWISYLDLLWVASYVLFGLGALYQKKYHESFM
ncbi:MAG: hypothetical protein R6W91_02835 [Thermoplasmata archaeon]